MLFDKLRKRVHCWRCKQFSKCPIKFAPSESVIYTKVDFTERGISLGDPIQCIKPLNTKKK